jgi:hypothetical protein
MDILEPKLSNCDICAEQKILVINETKQYEISLKKVFAIIFFVIYHQTSLKVLTKVGLDFHLHFA